MTLGDDLMKMSLSDAQSSKDPVSAATKTGRVPTLGEVKKSLKVSVDSWLFIYRQLMPLQSLVKNLIQVTTQMDPLPSTFTPAE